MYIYVYIHTYLYIYIYMYTYTYTYSRRCMIIEYTHFLSLSAAPNHPASTLSLSLPSSHTNMHIEQLLQVLQPHDLHPSICHTVIQMSLYIDVSIPMSLYLCPTHPCTHRTRALWKPKYKYQKTHTCKHEIHTRMGGEYISKHAVHVNMMQVYGGWGGKLPGEQASSRRSQP